MQIGYCLQLHNIKKKKKRRRKVDNIWIVHLQNQKYNLYQLAITATKAGEIERNYYVYTLI